VLVEEVGVECVVVPQPVIAARVLMTKTTSPITHEHLERTAALAFAITNPVV
jgi:hypothetical protein